MLVLVGVVAAGAVVAVDIARNFTDGPSEMCAALETNVRGIDSFQWDNGITGSGASWGSVLTDGVTQPSDTDRLLIAVALVDDGDGFEKLMETIPAESRPAAQRLYELAIDPNADSENAAAAQVDADATELMRLEHRACGSA